MDEETKELTPIPFSRSAREATGQVKEHDIDEDIAERAQEFIDEGIDESDAVDLAEEGL